MYFRGSILGGLGGGCVLDGLLGGSVLNGLVGGSTGWFCGGGLYWMGW